MKVEKHLGHEFQTSNAIINIDPIIKDLHVRTNIIVNKFRPISWQAKVALFLSQCSSLYGCQLWQLDDPKTKTLYRGWRVCCRKILGLHPFTRSCLLPSVMGTMSVYDVIMNRMLGFFIKGLNHESKVISAFFKNTLLSNSSYMLVNINTILDRFQIKYIDIFSTNSNIVKTILDRSNNNPDWRSNTVIELLSMREEQICSISNQREIKEILNYIFTYR